MTEDITTEQVLGDLHIRIAGLHTLTRFCRKPTFSNASS